MKFIRGLYIYTMYVLGLPFIIVMLAGVLIYDIVVVIRERLSYDEIFDGFKAICEGLSVGHAINMNFVKYGRQGYSVDKEIE